MPSTRSTKSFGPTGCAERASWRTAMRAIMADNDVTGHLKTLVLIWNSPEWQQLWEALALPVVTFEELGLSRTALDLDLWQECQRRQIVLVTGNRNRDDETSLEA